MIDTLQVECAVVSESVTVVTVAGEVDAHTAPALTVRALSACLRTKAHGTLIMDLRGVRFLAAAGLTVLFTMDRHCRDRDTLLLVVALHRAVLRPLEASGMIETLNVISGPPLQRAVLLRSALTSRMSVYLASGVLMAERGIDEAEALAVLTAESRRDNCTVGAVADRRLAAMVNRSDHGAAPWSVNHSGCSG